jgi:hypothetical protein
MPMASLILSSVDHSILAVQVVEDWSVRWMYFVCVLFVLDVVLSLLLVVNECLAIMEEWKQRI